MDDRRSDGAMNIQANTSGRRDALRALGTAGLAILAALGLSGAAAKPHNSGNGDKGAGNAGNTRGALQAAKKKKGKKKAGPPGPAGANGADGAAGPAGAPGPAGPSGADFVATRVLGDVSDGLEVETGSAVTSAASCGGAGKVLSCGYQLSANAAQKVNVLVTSVQTDTAASGCFASIQRISSVGSIAGTQIQAVALCRS